MMKINISENEYLIIIALLEQAMIDDYSKDELKEFYNLYRKLKKGGVVKDDE